MRSLPICLVILPILAVLQTTAAIQLQWFGGRPNFVLVTVLAWNLVSRDGDGLLWAFVGGLAMDGLSGGPMGIMLIAFLLVSVMTYLIGDRFWDTNSLPPLIVVIVGSIIYHLIYLSVLTISGWPVNWSESLTSVIFPSAALNLVVMLMVYPATRWLAVQITQSSDVV